LVTCYAQPDKLKSWRVLEAFAAGCKGKLTCTTAPDLAPGGAAFYGVRPGWLHLWKQAKDEQRELFYVDNAWFDMSREAYFRIGHNAVQSWSHKPSDGKRFARLGLKIQTWNKRGHRIIVCPQSDEFMASMASWPSWTHDVLATIGEHTDREIVVRTKRSGHPLATDLKNAWLLVAHSSAAAVEALLAGVPVIVTDRTCAAASFSSSFKTIEQPKYNDGREAWAAQLADSQWTTDEMKNGTAWRALHE
jgi:hypothetical protein